LKQQNNGIASFRRSITVVGAEHEKLASEMNRGEAQRVSAMLLPYFLPAGFRTAPQQTERLEKGASLSRKGQIALTTAYLILYQTRFL